MLRDLALPNLERAARAPDAAPRATSGDEHTLSPPHERALARGLGLARRRRRAAVRGARRPRPTASTSATRAWGLVTPAHWHVGRDHVAMADPDALQLDDDESRALFDAVRDAVRRATASRCVWGAPTRWYAAHASLAGLPLRVARPRDRPQRRPLAARRRAHPQPRLIRRLQSEMQMLLYPHPINDAREARGELPINSFWLSGCGVAQPAAPRARPQVDALACARRCSTATGAAGPRPGSARRRPDRRACCDARRAGDAAVR